MRQTIREFSVVGAWSKGITYHWRKFWGATLKSDDQWRRQDLVSGAHGDRGAKGAQWGWGMWRVSAPQPTRGSGGES